MTRCIHCTRCVRFGEEVAGIREMGAAGRGEHTKIGTFVEKNINSEVSGNIIDLCPVGALTSKPFRYKARAWELKQFNSISSHDSLGSNMLVHTYNNKAVRVVPRENDDINETWLSDRDRFSYEGIYKERLELPSIKSNGVWKDVSWEEAILFASDKIKNTASGKNSSSICGVISPNSTTEECFLFQKLIRSLGSNNVDHRTKQIDFSSQETYPVYPNLGCSLQDIKTFESMFIIGSDIHKELPLLAIRIRKLSLKNGKIFLLNPTKFDINFKAEKDVIPKNGNIILYLASILKSCIEIKKAKVSSELKNVLSQIKVSTQQKSLAKRICSTKTHILIGIVSQLRHDSSQIIGLSGLISKISSSSMGIINFSSNSSGAWMSGCVPHRLCNGESLPKSELGLNFNEMINNKNKIWLIQNVELQDCSNSSKFKKNLGDSCVINLTSFDSKEARSFSDVMLPISTNYETEGSFINCLGVSQSFKSSIPLVGKSKKGWKVLKTIGNYIKLEGFRYNNIKELQENISELITNKDLSDSKFKLDEFIPNKLESEKTGKNINTSILDNIYHSDNIVRRAPSLQKTLDAKNKDYLFVNKELANKYKIKDRLKLKNEVAEFIIPVIVNEKIEKNSIVAYLGTKTASVLEDLGNNFMVEGVW
jgi:NADH-quinone oxidoreductase subunit G